METRRSTSTHIFHTQNYNYDHVIALNKSFSEHRYSDHVHTRYGSNTVEEEENTKKPSSKFQGFWRNLGRKMRKEVKQKYWILMGCHKDGDHSAMNNSNKVHHHSPCYDEYTYSQNFDQWTNWAEPDNLSRSFTVRFAATSATMVKKGGMVMA